MMDSRSEVPGPSNTYIIRYLRYLRYLSSLQSEESLKGKVGTAVMNGEVSGPGKSMTLTLTMTMTKMTLLPQENLIQSPSKKSLKLDFYY